jgi:hypothetical protein
MQQIHFEGMLHSFPDDFTDDDISAALDAFKPSLAVEDPLEQEIEFSSAMQDGIHQPELETISAEEEAELFPESTQEALSEELPALNTKQQMFRDNIVQIETGGLDETFIRTQVNGSGSSAYGPMQITRGLTKGYLATKSALFTESELSAMNEMAERQRISLKIGGVDLPRYQKGGSEHAQAKVWAARYGFDSVDEFLKAFDYGGDLGLAGNAEFELSYEKFARKMLNDHLKGAGGDDLEAASRWHGGLNWSKAKSKKGTKAYRKKYESLKTE